ncbi:Moesin [Taenia solium]|eukprot:TsM_000227000 transcript=TsM_000227000 gene=TsM_000227000
MWLWMTVCFTLSQILYPALSHIRSSVEGLLETMSFDRKNVAGNEDLIKRLFNKVYSAILSEKIFCPPETAVYLAAYACQAKFGPAQALKVPVPPVKELLPKSILDNHNLSIAEWEERISKWHLKLRNTSFLDAIVEYLDIAQDVELYGASIFEVETKTQGRQWISLDAVGLNVYESKKKPPTKRYTWSDIASFSAWEDKIEIALLITFFVQHPQTCSLLESLFNGSRELYARRRKGDVSANYIRRSESNSSMRMRPHKLTTMELLNLEQQITELELELPRRATNYEYASWQVKDQLRQARGIEVKLSLNVPSTDETRLLQHRVAQIRVFLEQLEDCGRLEMPPQARVCLEQMQNVLESSLRQLERILLQSCVENARKAPTKSAPVAHIPFSFFEPTDRLHRYRGNFAIRVGGTLTNRSDDYSSDVDSGSERNGGSVPVWNASIVSQQDDQVKTTPSQPRQEPLPQSSIAQNATPNSVVSSSETEGHGYVEHPYPSDHKKRSDPSISTMPKLPESLPNSLGQPKLSTDDVPKKPATYNPEAYPKFPDRPRNPLTPVQETPTPAGAIYGESGYPEGRGSWEMDPPDSVSSSNVWKHVLRAPGQDPTDQFARGRIHGQLIEPDDVQMAYRPPVQPKPKVAPRVTADPKMVVPDYYNGVEPFRGPGQDPKFSTLKIIQSGYTKKRVDLFEAL